MAELITIAQALSLASKLQKISDTPRLDIELLLSAALGKDRTFLFTWPEHELEESAVTQFHQLLARRITGEPIAYILGQREFWSLPLKVNNSTLIPRPDTEVLVEAALACLPASSSRACMDLGTGTGAVALAIASEREDAWVTAIDANADAIALAKENAMRLDICNVHFEQASWHDLQWWHAQPRNQIDLIVSNPPYIDKNDPHLKQGDVSFEPLSALVANNRGLADIEVIVERSRLVLHTQGFLLLEHGFEQAESVRKIFETMGYSNIQARKDYGDNVRVTGGQYG